MPMTTYLRNALGNHTVRNVAYTSPTLVYLALFLSDPGDTGLLTSELTGTGYARIAITSGMGAFSNGESINSVEFLFATPVTSWGTPAYVGIMDAVAVGTGNMLYREAIQNPRLVNASDRPMRFLAGQLKVRHI